MHGPWILVLAGVGAVTILRAAYSLLNFVSLHFIKPSKALKSYKRAGPGPTYALITGASAGIGFGIARELVRQGFGVILLGHLPDELSESAATLRTLRPGADVKTIVMDVRKATVPDIQAAIKSLSDLQLSILVNNVGGNPISGQPFSPLAKYSCDDVDSVIDMNARFMARLTSLMLPILSLRRGLKERSLIINISSGAMIGLPYLVMYGATKAFNWSFSVALARELEADHETRHIDSLCVLPSDVHSQGNTQAVQPGSPTSDEFGRDIVQKVDGALWWRQRTLKAHWWHDIQDGIFAVLPERMRTEAVSDVAKKKGDAFNAAYHKGQ
jgi:17beta-estradiol 17-dehydrogenase / very-long-chain 3-oxoacyl-CoA reductase